MKTMLKKIVALAAIACMLISSVSVNAATKNYSQTALSRTAITREPGAQGFVALRNVNGKVIHQSYHLYIRLHYIQKDHIPEKFLKLIFIAKKQEHQKSLLYTMERNIYAQLQ